MTRGPKAKVQPHVGWTTTAAACAGSAAIRPESEPHSCDVPLRPSVTAGHGTSIYVLLILPCVENISRRSGGEGQEVSKRKVSILG